LAKTAAGNEQFATSGGATRLSGSAEQHHLALVQAFPIPPPAASCHHVSRHWRAPHRQRGLENDLMRNFHKKVFAGKNSQKKLYLCNLII